MCGSLVSACRASKKATEGEGEEQEAEVAGEKHGHRDKGTCMGMGWDGLVCAAGANGRGTHMLECTCAVC